MDGGEGRGLRVDAVWDIETRNWDEFVCGSLWTADDGVKIYRNPDELGERLMSLPKNAQVWAHAGGAFDVLWLLDWCISKGKIPDARVTLSGASIAACAFKGGPMLRDSARLIPMSLKKASTMFGGGVEKQELGLPCKCGQVSDENPKGCGGYCSIGRALVGPQRQRLIDYLTADVEALRDTLTKLIEFAGNNGIELAGTIAGSTWRTAKEWCGLPNADWESHTYNWVRSAYYGGRVEVGMTKADRVWHYDRTQAYPAAMCKALPCGAMKELVKASARKAFVSGKPGFYEGTIDIPESMAPPLPMRWENRVTYPWGEVTGVWARDEINRAIELGAKVKSLTRAAVWSREEKLLEGYMQHCFKLRESATTDSLKTWLKFLANSLSGAFAQDPERDIVRIGDLSEVPGYEPVGRSEIVWRKGVYSISDRGHIQWAATLTADARTELGSEIEHAGDNWVYSDTDSVKSTRELTRNVGAGLGLWKFEGADSPWECLAPKVYAHGKGNDFKAKAKGIREAHKTWNDIRERKPVKSVGGVLSLLVAARGEKMFKRKETSRHMKPENEWCGGRLRDGVRTRAPHVDDLARLP